MLVDFLFPCRPEPSFLVNCLAPEPLALGPGVEDPEEEEGTAMGVGVAGEGVVKGETFDPDFRCCRLWCAVDLSSACAGCG